MFSQRRLRCTLAVASVHFVTVSNKQVVSSPLAQPRRNELTSSRVSSNLELCEANKQKRLEADAKDRASTHTHLSKHHKLGAIQGACPLCSFLHVVSLRIQLRGFARVPSNLTQVHYNQASCVRVGCTLNQTYVDIMRGCAERPHAAARASLKRDRSGGLTSPAFYACSSASSFRACCCNSSQTQSLK
jgi:hypothetical protein